MLRDEPIRTKAIMDVTRNEPIYLLFNLEN